MTTEINIPDIGSDEMEVTEILIKIGDIIKKDQSILTIEGDKAILEIPSLFSGVVKEIKVNIGDKVRTGSPMLVVDINNDNICENNFNEIKKNKLENQIDDNINKNKNKCKISDDFFNSSFFNNKNTLLNKNVHATPSVRRLARELGIDLIKVKGNGPKGRILVSDIYNYVKKILNEKDLVFDKIYKNINISTNDYTYPLKDLSKSESDFIQEEKVSLTKIQKISNSTISNSWKNIPHVTQFEEADITDLEEFRKHQNNIIKEKKMNFKISLLSFIIKAISKGLNKFPIFNSYFSSDCNDFFLKKCVNIGIAVDTSNGLLVPVIRNVDKKDIIELSQELSEIVKKSRSNKLNLSDIKGGCFTVSNLGNIGGTLFTPIVKSPEVAILGLSKSSIKPIWNGKKFIPRLILPLSLSYDHRMINGADGARFLVFLRELISDIRLLNL